MDNLKSIYVTRHILDVGGKDGKNEGGYYIGTTTIDMLDHTNSRLPWERTPEDVIYPTLAEAAFATLDEFHLIRLIENSGFKLHSNMSYSFHVTDQNEHLFDGVKIKKVW